MEEIELRVAIYERLGLEFGSLPSESGNDWQRAKDEVLEENRQIEFEKLQQLKKIDYAKVDKESDEYKTVMNSKSLQMQVFHITISSRSDLLNLDINFYVFSSYQAVILFVHQLNYDCVLISF